MENKNILNDVPPQSDILQKINDSLHLLGCREEYIEAPEYLPEYEILKGKKITIVDDVVGVIGNNLPDYIVATGGEASAVYHKDQNIDELVSEIMEKDPDIILMDYTLANNINGVMVINELKDKGYSGKFVGYSSEERRKADFVQAGAIGCISKIAYPVSKAILDLIKLLD